MPVPVGSRLPALPGRTCTSRTASEARRWWRKLLAVPVAVPPAVLPVLFSASCGVSGSGCPRSGPGPTSALVNTMEVIRRLRLTPRRLLPPDSADPVPMGRGITVALLDQAVTFNFALRLSRWPGWVAMEEVQCEPVLFPVPGCQRERLASRSVPVPVLAPEAR